MKDEYPFVIRPLSKREGGPGRISDGATPEETIANGRDAVKSYLASCRKYGDRAPRAGSSSGQFRLRVPRTIHARLTSRAQQEGVSLNTLVTAMIAEGLGKRKAR